MPTFLDDLDAVDQSTIESSGPQYPVAQWLHGDPRLAAAGGVAHTGGIILPAKYVDDSIALAPGWARATVAFSSGKSEAVLAAQRPRLAVIRTRFRWFVVYNGVTTYYPRSGYQADSGMRGHIQALCGVNGFEHPIVATFKGKASQEFERLLKDFSDKVQEAAYKLARDKATRAANAPAPSRFPRFAFYMRLSPGPHVKVGQKGQESIITPPVLELPAVISEDYLSKVYVGRDRLLDYQETYRASAEWAAQWDRGQPSPDDEQLDEMIGQAESEPVRKPAHMPVGPAQTAAQAAGVSSAPTKAPPPPETWPPSDEEF